MVDLGARVKQCISQRYFPPIWFLGNCFCLLLCCRLLSFSKDVGAASRGLHYPGQHWVARVPDGRVETWSDMETSKSVQMHCENSIGDRPLSSEEEGVLIVNLADLVKVIKLTCLVSSCHLPPFPSWPQCKGSHIEKCSCLSNKLCFGLFTLFCIHIVYLSDHAALTELGSFVPWYPGVRRYLKLTGKTYKYSISINAWHALQLVKSFNLNWKLQPAAQL